MQPHNYEAPHGEKGRKEVLEIAKNIAADLKSELKDLRSEVDDVKPRLEVNKDNRKSLRLGIIKWTLCGVGVGFLVSMITSYFLYNLNQTPPELIVLNTVLGSTLTTLVGVIAGTNID